MKKGLIETNSDLTHQLSMLRQALLAAVVPRPMMAYVHSVAEACDDLEVEVQRVLKDLEYGLESTLPDILDATQRAGRLFDLLNTRFAPPIVRCVREDSLPLAVAEWLHEGHRSTRGLPFAVSDGGFAVYATGDWPTVYLLPLTRRNTILLMPLMFHEFGHVLYARHKAELDDLVAEFQKHVARVLEPTTVRDDPSSASGRSAGLTIAEAWYSWTQEVFCDAVGLVIGGESYLKAFSFYFRYRSAQEYYVPRRDQLQRRHPVTRIRTTMLLDRAKQLGLQATVLKVSDDWASTARTLSVDEDYEGTWMDEFFTVLRRTVDDMLEESSPLGFASPLAGSPVSLMAEAWTRFEADQQAFPSWEKAAIEDYLRGRMTQE